MNKLLLSFFFILAALPSIGANIVLEGCDKLTFDKGRGGNDCQVLKGNVRFRQENTIMVCDSAYFYNGQNSFDAFGNVRVYQDSIDLTANKMFYDGNTKLMRVRENITMSSGSMTLTTQSLDYYREKGYAYYEGGAEITDPAFQLTSLVGYYYPGSKSALFKKKVVLTGRDYKIETDTLKYNSKTSEAEVLGPSVIYRDQYVINTMSAYMNNNAGDFRIFMRSKIESQDKTQVMEADTILYNRSTGVVRLMGGVESYNMNQHVAMFGGYGEMHREPHMNGYMTKNAYIKEFSTADTLFLRADTLKMETFADSSRILEGNHNVRFYRSDFQGTGDVMKFFSKDSMVYMEGNPVLWADANQLMGDTVRLFMKNKRPDYLNIVGNAMVIQRDDSINYNQLKGNELQGYFKGSNLNRVVMKGNAMSVYYPKDKKGDLIGVNHNIGNKMTIVINDQRKLEKIFLEPGTEGTMYPPFEAPKEVSFLKGFSWKQDVRPKAPADIFTLFN